MYPEIFGVIDSYSVMLVLGFIAALLILFFYLKKNSYGRNQIIDLFLCAIVAIAAGVVFAILFQNLYDLIYYAKSYKWTWGMTFYGGLFGGAVFFFIMYLFYYKKHHESALKDLLLIAPGCICAAHSLGRIGCFLAGCCYGRETDMNIGMVFPVLNDGIKRMPTQLIEAVFLAVLAVILTIVAFKKINKYTFPFYMGTYGVFRFMIEFFRDDYRGRTILGMSPSQIWCILLFVGTPLMIYLIDKKFIKGELIDEKTNS